MSFFSTLRRKPEDEDLYEDYEYEDNYTDNYTTYEEDSRGWDDHEPEGAQPIRSFTDIQIVLASPQEYKDASKVADLLRDMKIIVLNLAQTDREIARRLLDFISGVIYTENGHIMKVATNVYMVAPYFVDLLGAQVEKEDFSI